MDTFTHLLIAFFIAFLSLIPFNSFFLILFAIFMAILPDFDAFLGSLYKKYKSELFLHKGASHSLPFAFLISFFISCFLSLFFQISFISFWITGFLFYSLHILLDLLASSRVPLFYPFIKRKYRFFIVRAINPLLGLISGFTMIYFYLIFFFTVDYVFIYNVTLFLGIYLSYFGFRTIVKLWFKILFPNALFIPGITPFVYMIYENQVSDNKTTFKLIKSSLFTKKKKLLLSSEIIKDSEEAYYFSKAKTLMKEYPFFSKWDGILPLWKNHDNFEMFLLLVESFTNHTVYYLKVTFNKISKRIIGKTNGFENILKNLGTEAPLNYAI
ncbi:MAG: metal-dependent hydrolase [Promethearchaeota archaeon]|nr:MAG: metal-dependent hydrolase [Candidatus Lokiarchaeota archaeon]